MTSVQTFDRFELERRRLFTLAYGFLGSRAEAEDVVQEVWLRWHRTAAEEKREPAAWLTTVTARLALDHLRSARVRRETYPGVWLPEPVVEEPSAENSLLEKSRLTLAFLFILEHLAPEERAALVLREVFDHSHREIAQILGKSEAASRQLVKRARDKIRDQRPAEPAGRPQTEEVIAGFLAALDAGDEQSLLGLLAPGAVLYGDGGGKALSVINPLQGADRIVRFLLGINRKYPGQFSARPVRVNGEPALLILLNGELHAVACYVVSGGQIERVFHVLNPDKLPLRRPS